MTPEEKDELLNRYVAGQFMTDAEELAVQNLLTSDRSFRADYRLRQELYELGKRERREAWDARQTVRPLPVKRSVFPIRWAAAASVVLLMGLGLFWWIQQSAGEPLTGQASLYEQHDEKLGLADPNPSPVGTVTWVVTKADQSQYEFSQADTLRIFTPDPGHWQGQRWALTRLSEIRYQLRMGSDTYLLEQGRAMRLPLDGNQ